MYFKNLDIKTLVYQRQGLKYQEEWKDIIDFEGFFQISNLGRVKSLSRRVNTYRKGRTVKSIIRKQKIHPTGYMYIGLRKNNINYTFKVHRLVAIHFIPNPENKPEVNHKKGNKLDNRFWMVEWSTPKENCEHRTIRNLIHSKLCPKKVLEIRSSKLTNKELSQKYNVSPTTISSIISRKSWWHIN